MTNPAHFTLSLFGDEVTPTFPEQITTAKAAEIAYLEVRTADGMNIAEMSQESLKAMSDALQAEGLGVSAIGSPIGKASITGDFDIELERLRACLDAADALETNMIRVFSYFIPNGEYETYREETLRRMDQLAAEASKREVLLVLENESYVYGDIPERCLDLISTVGSDSLMMCFDPANFVQVGVRSNRDAWELLHPYVRHFHIKDSIAVDREGIDPYPARAPEGRLMSAVRPAGLGQGDLEFLLQSLVDIGYQGYLTLEPHLRWYLPEAGAHECLDVAVTHLRALLDEVEGTVHLD